MAGSTGNFATTVAAGSALARKLFSVALFAQTQKTPGFARTLTGPAPSEGDAINKLKAQTSPDMPVVRVTDLQSTAGDAVSVDMFGVIGGNPIVGDSDAEGTGESLSSNSMDIKINLLTKAVDAGGKMSQKRTVHDLRNIAMAQLVSYFSRLDDQSTLVHLAGARGHATGTDWVIPADDGATTFDPIMVNDVKAPTYNRHYVTDGDVLVQGGHSVSSLVTTDQMKLEHIDHIATLIDDMDYPLQPVKVADDPAAADEPMYVLYLPPRVYNEFITQTGATGVRAMQQAAWNRASYGSKHPLFKGEAYMWRNILIKKLNRSIRFTSNTAYYAITSGNAATATETQVTYPVGVTAGYAIERSILLGGQALANCYGMNKSSDYHFAWYENKYNFGRALEVAGDCMGGKAKLRFNYGSTPTDHGVIAIDSVVSLA